MQSRTERQKGHLRAQGRAALLSLFWVRQTIYVAADRHFARRGNAGEQLGPRRPEGHVGGNGVTEASAGNPAFGEKTSIGASEYSLNLLFASSARERLDSTLGHGDMRCGHSFSPPQRIKTQANCKSARACPLPIRGRAVPARDAPHLMESARQSLA